jgi:hypothetical protein
MTALPGRLAEPRWWRTVGVSHQFVLGGSNIRRYQTAAAAANDAAKRLRAGDAWCAEVVLQARVSHGNYTDRHSVTVSGEQGEYEIAGPGFRRVSADAESLVGGLREALGLAERLLDRSL